MTESTIEMVRYLLAIVGEINITYDDNGCISFQHLVTSAVPDIDTFCRNSRQMVELQGTEEERRIHQCDFEPVFLTDTICTWTSRQSMHELRWWCVAI